MSRLRVERGSAAVELAVLGLPLLALLLLVVLAGRVSQANGEVRRAASEAARAASLRQHSGDATAAAQAAAASNLGDAGVECADLDTSVDTGEFRAGGHVAVTVRCTASLSDLTLLGVPGQQTFAARSVEVIDVLRGGER